MGAKSTAGKEAYQTFVQVEELQQPLCGQSRPHFFRGVATVRPFSLSTAPSAVIVVHAFSHLSSDTMTALALYRVRTRHLQYITGCGKALQYCRARCGSVWKEGLPAVPCAQHNGAGARLSSEGHWHAHCAGRRWLSHEQVHALHMSSKYLAVSFHNLRMSAPYCCMCWSVHVSSCSRNKLLSQDDRQRALCISKALKVSAGSSCHCLCKGTLF